MAEPARLAEEQRRALDRLSTRDELAAFYLAGGSAIALHLGHRVSLDLDFFSLQPEVDLEPVAAAAGRVFDRCEVVARTDVTVQLLCDEARIDFVRYPYPLLDAPTVAAPGIMVAGLRDLGTMKLAAIARRGLRRDFWDLHAILDANRDDLASLGAAYVHRFGARESDLYHVLKSLTYFVDAESDPALPAGLTERRWSEIKAFFLRTAPELVGG
jgi:hypothetical protein